MVFALNVVSAVLTLVALAVSYLASVPFPDPSWKRDTLPEQRHRQRRARLALTGFAIAVFVAAIQIYLAHQV